MLTKSPPSYTLVKRWSGATKSWSVALWVTQPMAGKSDLLTSHVNLSTETATVIHGVAVAFCFLNCYPLTVKQIQLEKPRHDIQT